MGRTMWSPLVRPRLHSQRILVIHSLYLCLFIAPVVLSLASSPPRAMILPLHHGQFNNSIMDRETASLRRNLIGEARMWLYGHILTRGYYYTNLWVGTPPQRFSLIVDTGSTVTYVPCSTCTECGTHQDSPFLPSASSTYQPVACQSANCPLQQCDGQQRCVYQRHYAEESSSSGMLATDVVSFGDASTIDGPKVIFGCETRETGDLYTQKADGIIGLGHGPLSIVDQLVAQQATANVFSLCYGGMERGGGSMVLGEVALPDGIVYTPLDPARLGVSAYYNLIIEELRVGGQRLDLAADTFEQGYGAVLDSGTTFTYLPKPAFEPFVAALAAGLKAGMKRVDGPDPKYQDICFEGASNDLAHLGEYFPQVDFVFGQSAVYHLSPENYLFKHHKVEGAYCLGFFQNADKGTLLGGILVRNTLVTYDRVHSQVGFYKTQCENLFETLASDNPTPSGPSDKPVPVDPFAEAERPEVPANSSSQSASPKASHGPPPGNESAQTAQNGTSDAACVDCAARVMITMTLQSPEYDSFGPLIPAFMEDMARELSVQQSQLEIMGYKRGEPLGVKVELAVLPQSPETFLPSATAKHIEEVLSSQELGLRDAFSGYKIESVNVLPINANGNASAWWLRFAVSFLGVLVGGGLVVGVAWWYRRRRQLQVYAKMGLATLDDDDEDEKTALGPGNSANL